MWVAGTEVLKLSPSACQVAHEWESESDIGETGLEPGTPNNTHISVPEMLDFFFFISLFIYSKQRARDEEGERKIL